MKKGRVSAVIVLVLGVAGIVGMLFSPSYNEPMLFLAAISFIVVGALVLAKANGNRVGLVLGLIGLTLTASAISGRLADSGLVAGAAIGGAMWLSWFFLAGFLLLWFPTGRPPSPRWRVLEAIGYLGVLVALSYVVADELCVDESSVEGCSAWVENPIGITGVPNPEYGPFNTVGYVVLLLFFLASFVSLVIRYVKSRRQERLQLKWFLFSVAALISVVVFEEWGIVGELPGVVGDSLFGAAVAALPVSIGLAVLRFRLYDIEKVISRTVGYIVVVGMLALVYVVGAVWLPSLFVDSQSPLFVAGTTLAAAAAFNPVRRRVLHVIDKRFYRSRYDAERISEEFANKLRDEVSPDGLMNEWVGVVSTTLRPALVGVWMKDTR